jgi:hypothetical protein
MEIKIFYSWQAKTGIKENRNYIYNCINKAIKKIKLDDIKLELIQSADNKPGSPEIAHTIMDENIPNCDIFIADLSITDSLSYFEKLFKRKREIHQAINVIMEYGVAYHSIGKDRIIGVLNSKYGSAKDKSIDVIPFDIKHLRFPIEYRYKKNEIVFISKLKSAIESCVDSAINERKNKYKPFISWHEWAKKSSNKEVFYNNDYINSIIKQLKESITDIRLLGLSGLGKTRIVFEAFKDTNNLLYCDANDYQDRILSKFDSICDEKEKYTIIIDNCNLSFLRKIKRIKYEKESVCRIISIYNQPEEEYEDRINDIDYINISIEKLESIVDKIIKNQFKNLTDFEQKTIKEFSAGIPFMAILLAESTGNSNNNIGEISDKDLLNKLLLDPTKDEKKILETCSLFKKIGFDGELQNEIKLIILNSKITTISGNDDSKITLFYELFDKYNKREIFEKRGRLFSIRPKPLAFYLAKEWFNSCDTNRLQEVINILKDNQNLSYSLCEQIKYLGDDEKVKILINGLLNKNNLFDNAEVINTEVGSRLFRSFVEVNPEAVADCLYRNFINKPEEQLKSINEGRRNLVWTLGKLCFDKRTFEKGAKLMMLFAVAENEPWGNNATEEFIHLFKVLLPGTQVNLEERFKIIIYGLNKDNIEYKKLSIKAIESAFLTYSCFFSGAETQGTKQLEHYKPTYGEIKKYWTKCLEILNNIEKDNVLYDQMCKIIENSVWEICKNGMTDAIIPIIEKISQEKQYDWDKMYENLHFILNDKLKLNENQIKSINSLIEKLTKKDFVSRFINIDKKDRWQKHEIKWQEKQKQRKEEYKQFAIKFVNEEKLSNKILEDLYTTTDLFFNADIFGYFVAKEIENDIEKNKKLINDSIIIFNKYKQKGINVNIFINYAKGINEEVFDLLQKKLLEEQQNSYLLFPILGYRNIGIKDINKLDILFKLIDDKIVNVSEFKIFFGYYPLNTDKYLIQKILNYGIDGLNTIINSFNIYTFNENIDIANILIEDIQKTSLKEIEDKEKLFEIIEDVLNKEYNVNLAKYINKEIINNSKDIKELYLKDYEINKIYDILFKDYFDDIYKELFSALLCNNDYSIYLRLSYVFKSNTNLFLDEHIDKIIAFCENSPKDILYRIVSIAPTHTSEEFTPFINKLLDKFNDDDDSINEILSGLSSNLGSYSWSGSMVPFLKSRKKLYETLLNYKNQIVVDWANKKISYISREIELEKISDAESKFLYN